MEDEIYELRLLINDIIDAETDGNFAMWIKYRLSQIDKTTEC